MSATFKTRVVFDPAALAAYLRSPSGGMYRQMMEDGEAVKQEARRRVGVHAPDPWGRPQNRRPGQLRDSIVKRMVVGGDGLPEMMVGSEDRIALWHHEGTQPHDIAARRAPLLVFWIPYRTFTRVIRTKLVHHPGTKPNRYLVDALEVLRRRY